ncbi:MAG: hypothetical protein QM680_04775 [Luteolibacter sp.]
MLEHWTPSSRDRFTGADFDFLSNLLASGQQRHHLAKLWNDPAALREILDLKEVFRGLLDSSSTLRLSPYFYFYVLIRHTFRESGITDSDLADYVSSVLASRLNVQSSDPLQDIAHGLTHAADFIAIISTSHGRMRFHLQVAAGNQFLVLTGLFPGFINRRCERHGTPDLAFYEAFAQQAYRGAAENPLVPGGRHLLGALAEALPTARRSLNRVAEEFMFLGE